MKKSEKTLEASLKDLQEIVQRIEDGDTSLEDSIEELKNGLSLAKSIKAKLNDVQTEVDKISGDFENLTKK